MQGKLPSLGVGLAFQAPLLPMLDPPSAAIDFVELVPDILWIDRGRSAQPRHLDDEAGVAMLARIARHRPIVAHGIGLSIGSADYLDRGHLAQLQRWHRRLGFAWHSDHLSFHRVEHDAQTVNAGITLPLARDQETLDLLVPRVAAVRAAIARPFLLENNVYYFEMPQQQMDEARFLNRLCRESGCGLLLDLHNLYTNARNHGFDAAALLAELDLDQVGEIHVAGGMELDGFYLDGHSGAVPDAVWTLLEWTLPRCPNVGGVVFEVFGAWAEALGIEGVEAQLRRMRQIWRSPRRASTSRRRRQVFA